MRHIEFVQKKMKLELERKAIKKSRQQNKCLPRMQTITTEDGEPKGVFSVYFSGRPLQKEEYELLQKSQETQRHMIGIDFTKREITDL